MNLSLKQAKGVLAELVKAVDSCGNDIGDHRVTGWMLEHFAIECGLTPKEQIELRDYLVSVMMKT
ncbi:MAG: hypothetical protein V3S69_05665 [Dehalococcoidales bacterium]